MWRGLRMNMLSLYDALAPIYAWLTCGAPIWDWRLSRIVSEYAHMLPLGALSLDAASGGARWHSLFESQRYISLDITRDSKSALQGDICALPIQSQTLDAVLCTNTLEHLAEPGQAVKEMWRVLKLGGTVLISVPFFYPVHCSESYGDYYRWTEFGLRKMLIRNGFEVASLYYMGGLFSAMAETVARCIMELLAPPRRLKSIIIRVPFYLGQCLVRLVLLPIEVVMASLDVVYRKRSCTAGYTIIGRKVDKVGRANIGWRANDD